MKVYGIKNCDTVKKALNWLDNHHIAYEFHDFKKSGITEDKLREWAGKVGWESLINKKGITWKKLDPAVQHAVSTEDAAFSLMQEKTSVIKRPVVEDGEILLQGFDEKIYSETFAER